MPLVFIPSILDHLLGIDPAAERAKFEAELQPGQKVVALWAANDILFSCPATVVVVNRKTVRVRLLNEGPACGYSTRAEMLLPLWCNGTGKMTEHFGVDLYENQPPFISRYGTKGS